MRISDWSSDVCSSDLPGIGLLLGRALRVREDGSVERELLPTPNDRATLASGGATIVQQGFSFTMDAFRSAGGFNAANRSTWDYELLARFAAAEVPFAVVDDRSEEHTSELQSLLRFSYPVFCLKKK